MSEVNLLIETERDYIKLNMPDALELYNQLKAFIEQNQEVATDEGQFSLLKEVEDLEFENKDLRMRIEELDEIIKNYETNL